MSTRRGLGRVEHFDPRNLDWRIADVMTPAPAESATALLLARGDVSDLAPKAALPEPERVSRYCNDAAWWGDQGDSPRCTAYALLHAMADGAVTHPKQNPLGDPIEVYEAIVRRDNAAGRYFDGGATSLAMAQEAVARGWIGEYRWGYSVDEVIAPLLRAEPVLLGIDWPDGMDTPDKEGIVRFRGRVRGGHEIDANGISLKRGLVRLKQSWDRRTYGRFGHVYLPLEDLNLAIAQGGDVTLFRELLTTQKKVA